MTALEKIQSEIQSLSRQDYESLRQWFWERDWQEWDQEIEQDSQAGHLDFLIQEALQEKKRGQLKVMP